MTTGYAITIIGTNTCVAPEHVGLVREMISAGLEVLWVARQWWLRQYNRSLNRNDPTPSDPHLAGLGRQADWHTSSAGVVRAQPLNYVYWFRETQKLERGAIDEARGHWQIFQVLLSPPHKRPGARLVHATACVPE